MATTTAIDCTGYKRDYPVFISDDENFDDFFAYVADAKQRFVIVDAEVARLYPDFTSRLRSVGTAFFVLEATETNKSLETLELLLAGVFEHAPNRDDIVVGIGGGLVLNIAGLLGSLIMRGIRFVHVPTTLTGQIDASLGSKQAINYRSAKNWVGMYGDPDCVYINPNFLQTATRRDINSQAIEGIKLCMATDATLFDEALPELPQLAHRQPSELRPFIEKMILVKCEVLKVDLAEHNAGMSLLYGHTIGHALEMLDHQAVNHGEGVGLGMLAAARIANLMGIAEHAMVEAHIDVLHRLDLPTRIPSHLDTYDIIAKLAHNKKNYAGNIRFVLLDRIGHMNETDGRCYTEVPEEFILKAISEGY